jgi:hypothetical protein
MIMGSRESVAQRKTVTSASMILIERTNLNFQCCYCPQGYCPKTQCLNKGHKTKVRWHTVLHATFSGGYWTRLGYELFWRKRGALSVIIENVWSYALVPDLCIVPESKMYRQRNKDASIGGSLPPRASTSRWVAIASAALATEEVIHSNSL